MEEMFKMMEDLPSKTKQVMDSPNSCHLMSYPAELQQQVPVITVSPLSKLPVLTIAIATQSRGYPYDYFMKDIAATCDYFTLDKSMVVPIFLKPIAENPEILDSTDAAQQMRDVLKKLNQKTLVAERNTHRHHSIPLPSGGVGLTKTSNVNEIITTAYEYSLRIVSLGIAGTKFNFEALEYMLNEWRAPKKYVQFVAKSDNKKNEFLQFWISACVNELCEAVQFLDISDYSLFGYHIGKGNAKRLYKTSHNEGEYVTAPALSDQRTAALSDQRTAALTDGDDDY